MKKIIGLLIVITIFTIGIVGCSSEPESISENEAGDSSTIIEEVVDDVSAEVEVVEEPKQEEPEINPIEKEEALKLEVNQDIINEYAFDDEEHIWSADFSASTDISFSEGNDVEWSYSHNRQEYPIKTCYLMINTTAETKHFWGNDKDFTVTYIFSGANKCNVEPSEGKVEKIECDDSNVIIYQKTLTAAKSKNAKSEKIVFKITPKEMCRMQVDVVYGSRVPSKYDARRAVDFVE